MTKPTLFALRRIRARLGLLSVSCLLALGGTVGGALAAPAAQIKRPSEYQGERLKRQRWPVKRPEKAIPPTPKLGPVPFLEGERLQFDIKMLGAKGGECILAVGKRQRKGNQGVVEFAAFLRSSEFLAKFYPIEDTLRVTVDERSFLPLTSSFDIKENKNEILYLTDFQQDRKLVLSDRHRKGKRTGRNFTTEGPIYEALSSVYAARRLDLKPGLKFEYYIWDGRRERLVQVEAIKEERIWTPLGWFDTIKVDISSVITGGFVSPSDLETPRKRGSAWFALDAHRTPVKLTTPTKLGDAEAVLARRWVETGEAGQVSAGTPPPGAPQAAPTSAP